MMSFQRTTENFACEHCGAFNTGNGYTNHCPHCLWSRHVDEDPGDREESCGGMMRPAALVGSSPKYRILHVCESCNTERLNNVQPLDSTDALVELAKHPKPRQGETINMKTGEDFDPLSREQSFPEATKGDIGHNR